MDFLRRPRSRGGKHISELPQNVRSFWGGEKLQSPFVIQSSTQERLAVFLVGENNMAGCDLAPRTALLRFN